MANPPPPPSSPEPVTDSDVDAMSAQLGRPLRGARAVAHRCACGLPDVVETSPRLLDGTPFPTLYYLTCPRATGATSTLEATGLMREMTERLRTDPGLASSYGAAHQAYLQTRESIEHVEEIAHVTAGGMPDRVKCLHVLVGHSLAAGPGVNPLGDEALAALPDWWRDGACVRLATHSAAHAATHPAGTAALDEDGDSGPM